MSITKILTYLAGGLLALCVAAPPQALADEWNQKTIFTFSGPVEIPGQVLEPGTYVFKLADSLSDRNVVEVFNKDDHLYGIFLAIPDYHLKPTDKPIITFGERASGAPEAVKAWFYPGDNYGHDFVYPKAKAAELAKVNQQPVPSMPNELTANTTKPTKSMNDAHVVAMKEAPLKAQQPTQQEVEIAKAFPSSPSSVAMARAAKIPKRLPKTASPLPLISLIGFLSLGAAASLGLATAKMKAR